jgi:predicted NBD/HSP70 family sugar kinase
MTALLHGDLRPASVRIGIDLGGTKIEVVALDGDGRELVRRRVPTPPQDYEATLEAMAELVRSLEQDLGVRGSVGIGMPGALSAATGLVKNANRGWLNDRRPDEGLAERLGRPIRLANDANCFALSEAVDGAGAGADCVFGVIVGTGTGGGLIVHGRIWRGPNAVAGEWGHNPLPWPESEEWPGPPCYCGKTGCIETFLSGPGLERDHLAKEGQALCAAEIGVRAGAGDHACLRTMERYESRMARALAHVINILDPDVFVLGGGLSSLERLYANVPRLWSRWVFSDRVDTRLLPPRHGNSSGVRGAAWLWPLDARS